MKKVAKRNDEHEAPSNYVNWLHALYPMYVKYPFGPRHHQMWKWAWNIEYGVHSPAFVGIWPRGSGKSTSAELLAVSLGAKKTRKYCWYISETQSQADQHVESISAMIENPFVGYYYPLFAERKLGKYGNVKAWRRNRLRCGNGFTVDAMGLDSARRGSKVEEQRPDLIILDDIDGKHDSLANTAKKIGTITTSILPAGSTDVCILAVQNLITETGVFSKLVDRSADFLRDRVISGPFKAVEGLKVEQLDGAFQITGGRATWEGQNLTICQNQINQWGYSAFLKEAQHEVTVDGGMFDHLIYQRCTKDQVPPMSRTTVWVDPAVTSNDNSDAMGIQVDGIGYDAKIYRLWSYEKVTTPLDAIQRAILKAIEFGSPTVGVETDQGGDTWLSVYERACANLQIPYDQAPAFCEAKAGAGFGSKVHRASQMLTDYENGRIIHVVNPEQTHLILEKSLNRFPMAKPYDLVDASFWSWYDLTEGASWLLSD